MATVQTPHRGEIWLVDFDPAVGAEINKLRPAVVISEDAVGRLPLRIVVPVTDWKPHYSTLPWLVNLPAATANGLRKESAADAFQAKSVSVRRLIRSIGQISPIQANDIAAAVALCVGAP
jgi:mRNA interferase MazF